MPTVLCYGDSNTWGYDPASGARHPREKRWPGVLAGLLPGCEIVEEGLPGRTTILDDPFEDGRNGLPYLGPCLASHAPIDVVVLMLGTNDTKTIFPRDAAGIAGGAARLVEVIQKSRSGPGQRAPQVLLVAPPPVTAPGPVQRIWGFSAGSVERAGQLAGFYRATAEMLGCAFLDGGSAAAVSPADAVHLDARAHEALGKAIAESVRPLLPAVAESR
jgi:lysophospholipase L1-like esterase